MPLGAGDGGQVFSFLGLPPHHLKLGTVHLTPSLFITDPQISLAFAQTLMWTSQQVTASLSGELRFQDGKDFWVIGGVPGSLDPGTECCQHLPQAGLSRCGISLFGPQVRADADATGCLLPYHLP